MVDNGRDYACLADNFRANTTNGFANDMTLPAAVRSVGSARTGSTLVGCWSEGNRTTTSGEEEHARKCTVKFVFRRGYKSPPPPQPPPPSLRRYYDAHTPSYVRATRARARALATFSYIFFSFVAVRPLCQRTLTV